jgi:hypothetical protein
MNYLCCFCGKEVKPNTSFSLLIKKIPAEENNTAQELYCHRLCLKNNLLDPQLLYIEYL